MVCLWYIDMFQSLHNIELARDMQDMRIRKKKRQTIRPLPGSFFLTKTSGVSRIPFKAAVNRKPPARCTLKQVSPEVFFFNSMDFIAFGEKHETNFLTCSCSCSCFFF